ncbi:MAG: magnesium transporter CorA, partial [Deltaproteobacteria bacterium]|nr:magnesium transporter CorA [Deltaproteobacteria bacterium]
KTKNVQWIHIVAPGESEIQYLRDQFQFHPLDLQDCVNIAQRPKVDEYDAYLFLILLFPHYFMSS